MEWNKVWAIGRETYARVYPNPGLGVCVGQYRAAASWYGGLEVFRKHPNIVWQRIFNLFSRVKRPGSK